MSKSETIGKLAEALAKAQSEMDSAKKDQTNPFFKSKYADLNSVIEAVKEPLSKHGLSYIQPPETDEQGNHYVVTTLMHSSGEYVSARLKLMLNKGDMQGLGSAITYARRYALSAMVGITQDDDDGNAATGKPKIDPNPGWKVGIPETAHIQMLAKKAQWSPPDVSSFVEKQFSKKFAEMNENEFAKLCHALETAAIK